MNPAKRPDPPDLSTGKENRDISDGTRRLVKPFKHLVEVSSANDTRSDVTVGVFEVGSPNLDSC